MNKHIHPHPEDEALSTRLQNLADRVRVNPYFMNELEHKLTEAHRPQKPSSQPWKLPVTALGWIALATLLFFGRAWFTNPQPPIQPAAPPSATAFTCPVTIPGDEKPASASAIPNFYGSPHLWTSVPFDGVYSVTAEDQDPDGSFSLKWGIWRKAGVKLDMSGTRLDAPAAPMRVFYTSGYDALGVQILVLTFPTPGCWQVTAQAGEHNLTFVIELRLDESAPLTEPACPVTLPNGNTPPNETASEGYYGNGQLWTALWPNGIVTMTADNRAADGSLSMKWPFWRGVAGPLEITGRQLDGTNGPVRADIPDGYGETGFQATGLIFPAEGCWEVTARVGEATLTFVTQVIYEQTNTNAVGGYAWRDTILFVNVAVPASPATANVFQVMPEQFESIAKLKPFSGDTLLSETTPESFPSVGIYRIISANDALQKILAPQPGIGMLEMLYGANGGGAGGGTGFYSLNLNGDSTITPTAPSDRTYALTVNPYTAHITSIQLVYFIRNPNSPRWSILEDPFLQPVWQFKGHYTNGDTFEIIVQALPPNYLGPTIERFEPPG